MTTQKKTLYDKKYAIQNDKTTAISTTIAQSILIDNKASIVPPQEITMTFPPKPVVSDPLAALTEQISRLALAVQAILQNHLSDNMSNTNIPASTPASQVDCSQCVWCDSKDRSRRDCSGVAKTLHFRRVGINDKEGVICNDEKLPLI